MPKITIKNFKGVVDTRESLWNQGFAKYCVGIDLFGLKENSSSISSPGVLQGMRTMAAGTEAAATDDITDLIVATALYPTTGNVWGFSAAAAPRLYERTGGTWTRRRSGADVTSSLAGAGLAAHAGSLWVSQAAAVARWDNAVWTNPFGSFTSSTTNPRPMKQFAGNLYIGNNQYVSQIDSTPTFTAAKLTLPADFVVQSMEVYGDRLWISADNTSFARIFIWDGSSATFESFLDLKDETTGPYLIQNEGYLWAVAARGVTTPGTPVYIFNGSSFSKLFSLPIQVNSGIANCLAVYRGGILIGSNSDATTYEDGVGGIWMINRADSNDPWHAVLAFNPSNGVTSVRMGGIYASGNTVYVGTRNTSSSAFEVWETSGTATNATGIWQSLPIDADDPTRIKTWHGIQINPESDITSTRTVVIKYRLDYASSFTTLKTVNVAGSSNRYIPLGRTGKVIEIRLELISPSSGISTRVHGFTLDYSYNNL